MSLCDMDFYAIIIEYDTNCQENVNHFLEFHKKLICLELLTAKIESRQKTKKVKEVTHFCYCQQPYNDDEETIDCDTLIFFYKHNSYKHIYGRNCKKISIC